MPPFIHYNLSIIIHLIQSHDRFSPTLPHSQTLSRPSIPHQHLSLTLSPSSQKPIRHQNSPSTTSSTKTRPSRILPLCLIPPNIRKVTLQTHRQHPSNERINLTLQPTPLQLIRPQNPFPIGSNLYFPTFWFAQRQNLLRVNLVRALSVGPGKQHNLTEKFKNLHQLPAHFNVFGVVLRHFDPTQYRSKLPHDIDECACLTDFYRSNDKLHIFQKSCLFSK